MEKPDANGFINITWPSKSIPHGGIFHTRVVEPSTERQEFLKVLLEESKLSIAQRQKTPFQLRQAEESEPEPRFEQPLVRPRTSRRRSLSAIRESGVYEVEPYKPIKRGEDREKLIERLANTMAYGDNPEQVPPPPPRIPKPAPKLPTAKEQWQDLVTQIRERAEWLAEMEDLGQAEPHREMVKNQIAERMRALNALGIDSQCSSARSGFSTLRSREPMTTARSNGSAAKSVRSQDSKASQGKPQSTRSKASTKSRGKPPSPANKEESVADYQQFSSLQYTPRRRV